MLLNKLKQFHQQTMERYRDEENMEPWKKAVMEIHEKATNQELNFEKLRSSINLCCEVCLWDTSDAMMEPDKKNSYWFFFNS